MAATLAAGALAAGCSAGGDTATAPTTPVSAAAAPGPAEDDPTSTTAAPDGVSGAATLGSAAGRGRGGGSTTRDPSETPDEVDASGADGADGADEVASDVTWSLGATDYRGDDGLLVAYDCPADGVLGSVWGSGPYTDDSSVCTAAVHAGLITATAGGEVVIEIGAGLDAYEASTAHGVTTLAYGPWSGSFTFAGP